MRQLRPRPVDTADVEGAYADLASRRTAGRPYVFVNMVASADGAISIGGRTSGLSTEADRHVFHYLRSLADVILVGAQTVRAERYGPPRVAPQRQADRVARGQTPVPRIAIVSASLDLDWSSRLFTDSPTRPIVLAPVDVDAGRVSAVRDVADVVLAGERRVDLVTALAELHRLGAGSVLCEGGPTLNGILAANELIDELCLTVAPVLVGGEVATGLLGHIRLADLVPMSLVHVLEEDGDLFLRYRRRSESRAIVSKRADAATDDRGEPDVGAFHEVVGAVDNPMVIVTASDGTRHGGCLVGFSSQSSIDPPRYTVWISKRNHTYRIASATDILAVHFPDAGQRDLAVLFGTETGDDRDKFADCAWHPGLAGVPILDGVTHWFAGRVVETLDAGDHVAFVLAPLDGSAGTWGGQLGFQAVRDLPAGHDA